MWLTVSRRRVAQNARNWDVPVQRPPGLIEILLPENVTLRVDSRVDGQALRRVLAALAAR